MSTDTMANRELRFLKSSALLSAVLGTLFIVDSVPLMLFQYQELPNVLRSTVHVMQILFILGLVYLLIKNISAINGVPSRTTWLSQFDDEFLNHTNMKGYQYAFNLAIAALFIGTLGGEIWVDYTDHIPIHVFSEFVLGIAMAGYSIPVLRALLGEKS